MNEISVADGFRFGCGFFIAGFVAWLVMVVVLFIISLVFGAALGGIFEGLDTLGQALPLLGIL